MRKTKLKNIILAAVMTLTMGVQGIFATVPVEAKRAIVMSPTSQKIILIPGEKYRGSIRVTNPFNADEDLHYQVTVGSYSVSKGNGSKDDYGEADIETIFDQNAIMNWITLDEKTGVAKPNEEKTIAFTINVPNDAPAGGQYATLLVKDTVSNEVTEGSMGITENIQMASIIYAEVAGETRRTATITENNIPSFITSGDLQATSMIKNTGNTHDDAEYIFQVWPMFSDEEICTNEEDVSTSLILPNTERYHTESCSIPAVGIFRAKQTVRIFNEESIVEKTVIACPLWLMVLVLIIIVAIVVGIVILIRRGKNRKKAGKSENTAE